jgi:hypothetical protein
MSQTPAPRPRRRIIEGSLFDDLKLKKEEVIYKGSVCTNTRVLPLHTASASRAGARDHVTWNARTVCQNRNS